jgi:hypothetical protein
MAESPEHIVRGVAGTHLSYGGFGNKFMALITKLGY